LNLEDDADDDNDDDDNKLAHMDVSGGVGDTNN